MRDISSCSKPRKVSTFRILRAYLVVLRVDRFMACPYWCSLANCLRKRWVYRKRHLSSLPALRANDDVGNVRLERTIRLIYSKLKARSKLRTRTRSDSASHLSTGSDPRVRSNPLPPTTIGENGSRSQGDPGHDDDVASGFYPHVNKGSVAHREA